MWNWFLAACSIPGAPSTATASSGPTDPACAATVSSSLPGVHLEFTTPGCTVPAGSKGHVATYRIVATSPLASVVHEPMFDGQRPATDGFMALERIHGNGHSYSAVDFGDPIPTTAVTAPLPVGTLARTFSWDAFDYLGPCCTGEKPTTPFPAGEYAFEVTFRGTMPDGTPWKLEGRQPIRVR